MKKNNRGISMLLVIAALLVTGFIGTSLIKMATADRLSGIYFSSSESARSAAKSGLTAALVRIGSTKQETKDSILVILNRWAKSAKPDTLSEYRYIWLIGGPNSVAADHQWQSLSSGSVEKFRTRIDAFNPNTFEITLVSEGVGVGGSKSTAIGVYDLKNLVRAGSSVLPTNALQMDNGAFEFNVNLVVNGNTSVKKGMRCNADSAVFNGTFRADTLTKSNGTKQGDWLGFSLRRLRFLDRVYCGLPVRFGVNNPSVGTPTTYFAKTAGFSEKMYFKEKFDPIKIFNFYGDTLILNDGAGNLDGGSIGLNSKRLMAYGTNNCSRGLDTTGRTNNCSFTDIFSSYAGGSIASKASIPQLIGFPTSPDPKITFDTTKLGTPHIVRNGTDYDGTHQITADSLNLWYQQNSGSLLNGTFLVVRIKGSEHYASGVLKSSNTTFTGKAIIWVDDGHTIYGDGIKTTHTANLSYYVHNNSDNQNHFKNCPYFRGFVYINNNTGASTDYFVLYNTANDTLDGAIYGGESSQFKFDGGSSYTRYVNWDASVISELAVLGIFANNSNGNSDITLSGSRINPVILNQAM